MADRDDFTGMVEGSGDRDPANAQLHPTETSSSRPKSSKGNLKNNTPHLKKKKDVPQGKRGKKYNNNERGKQTGKKKQEKVGSNSQTLQSGQTTVQFSSGGNIASLGSLMGLFTSSENLARTDFGSSLNYAQTTLNGRDISRTSDGKNLMGLEAKAIKEAPKELAATPTQEAGKTANLEATAVNGSSATANNISSILKIIGNIGISTTQAAEMRDVVMPINTFNANYSGYINQYFNANSFFFNSDTKFVFLNNPGSYSRSDVIDQYLKDANIPTTATYTYQILSPVQDLGILGVPQPGFTIQPGENLRLATLATPLTPLNFNSTPGTGLTITPTGSLLVNVTSPISVFVKIIPLGQNADDVNATLPVRISAGPGGTVMQANPLGYLGYGGDTANRMTGLKISGTDEFANTVFISGDPNIIIGNSQTITLNSPGSIMGSLYTLGAAGEQVAQNLGNLAYIKGLGSRLGTVDVGTFTINSSYVFPSSTIFRHVVTLPTATSPEITYPSQGTYGNFASYVNPDFLGYPSDVSYSTLDFLGGSYNLTFGGNVLDVYGTKYGVGDVLRINPGTNPSTANTVTMGNNTLAGFGESYGDLKTLTITGSPDGSNATAPTNLVFKGNLLTVDKNIDSTLYPHLQTLDMEYSSATLVPSFPANVKIHFQDSIIQGNQGSDKFYGDIEDLASPTNSKSYNGFLKGVNVGSLNGQVVTTTTDGNNNTIIWGNNIYDGGGQSLDGGKIAKDSYNFTLLTDENTQSPVMQGNVLLTNFNISHDILKFQISPDLFKILNGRGGGGYIKEITASDLDAATDLSPFSFSTAASHASEALSASNPLYNIDPNFVKYLLQYNPNQNIQGITITFDEGMGGTFTFINNASTFNMSGFSQITNFDVDVAFTYAPVIHLPAGQTTASTPTQLGPFIYGKNPVSPMLTSTYHNELDNFFAHSLYAAYATGGSMPIPSVVVKSTPTSVTTHNGTANGTAPQSGSYTTLSIPNDPGNAVIIDPYGTITVKNAVPFFVPLTIVATDQNGGTDTSTQWFGFLNATISTHGDQPAPLNGAPLPIIAGISDGPNIITGGQNLAIVGRNKVHLNLDIPGDSSLPDSFQSALISNTGGNSIAYGDFKSINFHVNGVDNVATLPLDSTVNQQTTYANNSTTFNTNAFYVTNGVTYGITENFNISVQGGDNASIAFSSLNKTATVDASAHYDGNHIIIQPQTLYGWGTMFAYMDTLEINVTGGADPEATFVGINPTKVSGTLDVSASVTGNQFIFSSSSPQFPTTVTVVGDSAGNTTTIYGSLKSLLITTQAGHFDVTTPTLTIDASAVFSGNQFIFGDTILKGGLSATIFYGDLYTFGDPFNPNIPYYNGFVNGVTATVRKVASAVTGQSEDVLTVTDGNGNSITWSNNIYTGGTAITETGPMNVYNFTLVGDKNHQPIMQGFDAITNFNPARDKLVFNIQSNLFEQLGMGGINPQDASYQKQLAAKLGAGLSISYDGSNTKIGFDGGGSLDLRGWEGPEHLEELLNTYPNSIQVNYLGSPYVAPTLHPEGSFKPVILEGLTYPNAFSGLVTSPLPLTYTVATPLPPGLTLAPNGALAFTLNSNAPNVPVYAFLNVEASDGVMPQPLALPTVFVMGIHATDGIIHKDAGALVQGNVKDAQAFETNTPGNTIVGGGEDIHYTPSSTQSNITYGSKVIYDTSYANGQGHTVYGNIQNINFTSDGATGTGTSGQTITFSKNIINSTGIIYGNAATLSMTGPGVDHITGNSFIFGGDVLIGGAGPNSFYGDLQVFGNSNNPTAYGTHNFYNGVTVLPSASNPDLVTVQDGNGNKITWGNETYIGGSTQNTYNFTIVGAQTTHNLVMQGNDTITNFNPVNDTLNFSLAYDAYDELANGQTLTGMQFLSSLNAAQTADAITFNFPGAGSITLKGYGTSSHMNVSDIKSLLAPSITVSLADPITANTNPVAPASNTIILGITDLYNTFAPYFNHGHDIQVTVAGVTQGSSGALNFNGHTGLINQTVTSISASDPYTQNVTATLPAPVRVIGIDGEIRDHIGDQQGASASDPLGLNPYLFIGHGNATIIGGISEISFSSTNDPTNGTAVLTYGAKIIYDVSGLTDTVYGIGNSINITNDGSVSGNFNTYSNSFFIGETYIEASGSLYGNFNNLYMAAASQAPAPHSNTFTFGDSTLVGGASGDSFYGHLQVFGNSNNPSYGENNFYDGVRVSTVTDLTTGENFIRVQDGNFNTITWGNATYTGGDGNDGYNFTIVGTKGATPQAVMQGFDKITDFNPLVDKLIFNLAYPIYDHMAQGNALTPHEFLSNLQVTQTPTEAIITFLGGGSLTLEGMGTNVYPTSTDLLNSLAGSIQVNLADPISLVEGAAAPPNNILILGNNDSYNSLAQYFNFGHSVSLSFGDITGMTIDGSGKLSYGANTGIIDVMANSMTIKDPYTSLTTTFTTPVKVLALNGAITDNPGDQFGSQAAGVFIGNGNQIIGGGNNINGVVSNGEAFDFNSINYGSKLIYNDAPTGVGTVTGDVENVSLVSQGATTPIIGDALPIDSQTAASSNLIDFGDTWIFSNAASSTYGNVQDIDLKTVGGTNIFTTGTLIDTQNVIGNTIQSGGNTVTASGDAYGIAENVSLTAINGFYSAASGSTSQTSISNNAFQAGGSTLTGNNGSSATLYGDYKTLSLTIYSPENVNGALVEHASFSNAVAATPNASVTVGKSVIDGNTFTFSGNTLVGSDVDTSLFAGIGKLVMVNSEQTFTNAAYAAGSANSISSNHIVFGDSSLTAMGGITQFNNDIDDLSQTNFDDYGVTASRTVDGHVQITDMVGTGNEASIHGNTITFGDNTMTASATGANIFNLDLFSTTDGDIVAQGNTTIKHFGDPGVSNENMLNLQLSEALYQDVSTYAQNQGITLEASNGKNLITASILDAYMVANNGSVTSSNGDSVINFSNAAHENLGSITLKGVSISSLADFGADVGITANGFTVIQAAANPSTTYDIVVSGDKASGFTQNVQVFNGSSLGHIIDFQGEINLNLSSAFFKAAGLSEDNTSAQNFQILQNNAATSIGGISVSSETSYSGATNTILSFTSGGHSYGNITLHNTNFNLADPLNTHIVITHT